MPSQIDSTLGEYVALVQKEFQKANGEAGSGEGLRLLLSEKELLLRLVQQVEQTREFRELVRVTAQEYEKDGGVTSGTWESEARNYFRLSGLYMSLFTGQNPKPSEVLEQYQAAFRAEKQTITYLAPIEFVEFSEDVLDFGGFQIRRFTQLELEAVSQNLARKVFYDWAYLDSAELEPYWFLQVRETLPARESGWAFVLSARVPLSYSEYPQPVQIALRHLALYDWGSNPFGPGERKDMLGKYDAWEGPFRPNIPFVISSSDSLIDSPRRGPDISSLVKVPCFDPATGEELGELPERGWWNERATREFRAFVQSCADLLARLQGIARLSVESRGSRVTHFTTPSCVWQAPTWTAPSVPIL